MKDTTSKILMKGGKEMDTALQIFQAIKNDPDGIELVNKIKDLVGENVALLKSENEEGRTILLYAYLNNKPSVFGYMIGFISGRERGDFDYLIDVHDVYGNTYFDYLANDYNPANIHSGGGYTMYNNKKYKICTGKRGGKYICVGVDKKKIYV
jgi:hypothetical protein